MAAKLKPVPSGRPTFLDSPRATDLERLDPHIAVLGVPFGMPSDLHRSTICATAPQTIREQSMRFVPRWRTHYDFDFEGDLQAGKDVKIVDVGDVPVVGGRWEEGQRTTTEAIRAIRARGAVP